MPLNPASYSMEPFRVRLNCVDHYQSTTTQFDPQFSRKHRTSKDPPNDCPRVPVIRVFGSTETGQKVCAHIHGVLPYLYIEYTGSTHPNSVALYIRSLHLSINHALAVSYRRDIQDGESAFVAHITVVKGIPFYGYHVGYRFFLKIYMFNPIYINRLASVLREGAVMKTAFQPYESHLQYLAQWMCDYNLYGCAYINCSKVNFRNPVPDYLELNNPSHQWHDRSIPANLISEQNRPYRQSYCAIEVDVCAENILNRLQIRERAVHNDFEEYMNPPNLNEKLVHSLEELWKDETRRRKAKLGQSDPTSSPFPPGVLISMSAEPRNSKAGNWIHENEYRDKIKQVISAERASNRRSMTLGSFIKPTPFENAIKTAFQSVADLFPENLSVLDYVVDQPSKDQSACMDFHEEHVYVDESLIPEFHDDEPGSDTDKEKFLVFGSDGWRNEQSSTENSRPVPQNKNNIKLGSEGYAADPNNIMHYSASHQPWASAELEHLGVRKMEDAANFDNDTFHIPPGCVSDMIMSNSQPRTMVPVMHSSQREQHSVFVHLKPARGVSRDDIECLHNKMTSLSESSHCFQRPLVVSDVNYYPRKNSDLEAYQDSSPEESALDNCKEALKSSLRRCEGSREAVISFTTIKNSPYPKKLLSPTPDYGALHPKKKAQDQSYRATPADENCPPPTPSIRPFIHENNCSNQHNQDTQTRQISSLLHLSFSISRIIEIFPFSPPPLRSITSDLVTEKGLPSLIYKGVYYSDEYDVPGRPRSYGGRDFMLGSETVPYLSLFDSAGESPASRGIETSIVVNYEILGRKSQWRKRRCTLNFWEMVAPPPSRAEVEAWENANNQAPKYEGGEENGERALEAVRIAFPSNPNARVSQIEGPTPKNERDYQCSRKEKFAGNHTGMQYMSIMSLEIHVDTRDLLNPNPENDEIQCVFWCCQLNSGEPILNRKKQDQHMGIITKTSLPSHTRKVYLATGVDIDQQSSELDIILRMVSIVREYDPDILTGYEIHNSSWGYMIERARLQYDYNLCDDLSRMKSQSHGRFGKENDTWGFNHTSTIRITGRHMINIWRAMRGELNLLQYTMENVVFNLLCRRIPHLSYHDRTIWYQSGNPKNLVKVLDFYLSRVRLDLDILERSELIPRTSEQARVLGIDFFSVFSRGSQFKVESIMFRIAKPENYLLISPSRSQVGQQNALECLPLVMEPQSAFYPDPVLVLDFQSLYPSIMIAYNYCYSTFLGRIMNWKGKNKMGFTEYRRDERLLELFQDHINIAPNGIVYVKPEVRKSLLAKMLGEILETRVMVKSGMKIDVENHPLQRLLNNRQLALKLLANVTYGYTSASFSGRMPCSEIADSIVQSGRETLEKAITFIHSVDKWNAEVIYGDTDSLFVHLKGRTKDEAFAIGEDIAKSVTELNPRPVKLKFEKIYLPCILLAKKRYVGYKYENRDQIQPDFDAKGIETVRRDGTPAEQKIEEKAIKILFRTADLSQVKRYFQRQCAKIMRGKISIQDFCFAKEVKLGTYNERGLQPPGALISTKKMLEDPRAEPQYGERVPYLVIAGAPGTRLVDRCVPPEVLLCNAQQELDAEYYISRNILPPLERIFNLMGANVRQWYDEMPKFQRIRQMEGTILQRGEKKGHIKMTLESYMKSSSCVVCQGKLQLDAETVWEYLICHNCLETVETSLVALRLRLAKAENRMAKLEKICQSCSNIAWGDEVICDSKDCPVFYSRARHRALLRNEEATIPPIINLLEVRAHHVDEYDW
ncbi:MAG: DNA polymerase zeta [Cirrosporium novae-zelandiae]|nr:MAG: DNA polymerase zeta [Cirrosporium novae-zelandiae]